MDTLDATIQTEILSPGSGGYDAARTVWNSMVDRRPAVIIRPIEPGDVARAIRHGRDRGLDIGVKGGGHSITGLCVPDGGLMIDLGAMASVRVDPDRRLAWVGGGAELGALDQASQRYGLAATAGNVSHTGVGGLTLGGGMGWLARLLGLACDNVESYQVATADGSIVLASATEHEDLFWGLRGGGGNFGIVTEFCFRLSEVGTTALSAELSHDLDTAPAVLSRWAGLIPEVPRQATLTAWAGRDRTGRPVARTGFVWVGPVEEGRRLLQRFRELDPAAEEEVSELSYVELQSIDDVPARHGLRRYSKGHYLRELSGAAIEAFLSVATSGVGSVHGSLQSYGGAIAEVGADDSAFSQRDALIEFNSSAGWTDPAADSDEIGSARSYGSAIEPFASGVYVNALSDEGSAGVERAYRAGQLRRLAALKATWDPDNVFHLNHNIVPA